MNSYIRLLPAAALCLCLSACAPGESDTKTSTQVAEAMLKHCVKVKVYAKRDDGEEPSNESSTDIRCERPTLWGGYLLDAGTVIVEDQVLHERFIRKIEVEADGKTVAAAIKGWNRNHQSLLLTLNEPLDGVEPMRFAPVPDRKEWGKLRTVNYAWDDGKWQVVVGGSPFQMVTQVEGGPTYAGGGSGVFVDPEGNPVGVGFDGRYSVEGGLFPWRGEDIAKLELVPAEAMHQKLDDLSARLKKVALEVEFNFRKVIEEDDGGTPEVTETFATGFAVSPERLVVPISMQRELVARIEGITVYVQDGENKQAFAAEFDGALKDYQALLVKLTSAKLPEHVDLSAPGEFKLGELFLTGNVDYKFKKRKEKLAYDRFRGYSRTYKDLPGVVTFTNEDDGSIAFDVSGKPLAISLANRTPPDGDQYGGYGRYSYRSYGGDSGSMFRPVKLLADALAAGADGIDPTICPLEKEHEKKIVSFGVEWQGLNLDLSKQFKAEKETRGGEIGLLVVYVYPGMDAAGLGLQPEDILLRLKAPDKNEPIELRSGYGGYRYGGYGGYGGGYGDYGGSWPSRNNSLTQLLTEIGEGKKVKIEYLRDGKLGSIEFVTSKGPVDFDSAPKHKSKALGLTVKSVTYEVKRYLMRQDDSGVIVSRVEPGSKAEVGGIYMHQLITQVDGKPVAGLDDFKEKTKAFEEGKAKVIEFTLESMGKTRLVKIEAGGVSAVAVGEDGVEGGEDGENAEAAGGGEE